ncbi:MAG TPA: metallophosphoesterase [Xanthobacteraceae bacterium]|jgi:hypothetical protein|nr:metallophosphoesterase [Xanthobacteraceae bacterium]
MAVNRRNVIMGGLGIAGALGATANYAAAIEPFDLKVTEYRLTPHSWPRQQHLSIAVISDLHAGGPNMGLERIRHVVETTNALKPDLTVLLGDYIATHAFVTERVTHADWGSALAGLSAPLGVWAILGNHDWSQDVHIIRHTFMNADIPVLENTAVHLNKKGQRFWLGGLGDQLAHSRTRSGFRGVDDLPGTLRRAQDSNDPFILLAHEPDIFPKVPSRVALTLCGHTHGAQIRVPFLWPYFVPSRFGARYAYGHIVEQDRHMVVSGGLGTSLIPARLGVPPEIVHIELGA